MEQPSTTPKTTTPKTTTLRRRSRSIDKTEKADDIFRLLVDAVRDYAIFVLDPQGYVLTWNAGAQNIKGYTKDQILGKHFSVFYPKEAVDSQWPTLELSLAEKEGRFVDEGWRVKKDGTHFWASVTITALRRGDGRLCGFAKVTQDLTGRKQAEERIQSLNKELRARVTQLDESQRIVELRTLELQKLSGNLLQIQDEERRRIARELHDDLAQDVTALKMDLVTGAVQRASELADTVLEKVRDISYLLHPPLLDEAGLRAALYWFVDGVAKRTNIQVSLTMIPDAFPRLPSEIETAIFRVVQESLTNVYRHSGTQRARVDIEKQSEQVKVRVRDYGNGIPPRVDSKVTTRGLGVGISGMRERLRQFGGELSMSLAEPGTLVEAKIPLFGPELLPASI